MSKKSNPNISFLNKLDDAKTFFSEVGSRKGKDEYTEKSLYRLAFHLNVYVLLGEDASKCADDLYDAANVIHAEGIREISNLNVLPDWLPIPSKIRKRRALKTLDGFVWQVIRNRRQSVSMTVACTKSLSNNFSIAS